ncbi:hypothetical protein CerSpe_170080 [Prunus speciosa]
MAQTRDVEKQNKLRQINEIQTIINEQEKRLSSLQSNGFSLANFFLVFQGVILAAVANGSSVFTCLDCWLLIGVSALAVCPNLASLYLIGQEYIATITQRDASLDQRSTLKTELDSLQAPTSAGTSPQVQAQSSGAGTSTLQGRSSNKNGDSCRKRNRQFWFFICMACFVGVSVIMGAVSVRTLCSKVAVPKYPLKLNDKCVRFCQGSRCMRFCSEY